MVRKNKREERNENLKMRKKKIGKSVRFNKMVDEQTEKGRD